jgi:hypothetical protein
MRIALLLSLLLLVAGSAQALESIPLVLKTASDGTQQYIGDKQFSQKGAETYNWNLNGLAGMNGSATLGANDSIVFADVTGQYSSPITISQSTSFKIDIQWNSTQDAAVTFTYLKSGFLGLYSWKATYSASINGNQLCSATSTNWNGFGIVPALTGPSITVTPIAYIYTGFYNTLTNSTNFFINYGDINIKPIGDNDGCANSMIGNLTQFQSNFYTIFGPGDYQPHDERATGVFANNSQATTNANVANASFQDNAVDICSFSLTKIVGSFFNCILGPILSGLLKGVFALVFGPSGVINSVFGWIPGFSGLLNFITTPFQWGIDTLTFLLKIYTSSGSNYPGGGVYIALIVWSIAMGFAFAGITGDMIWAWKFPAGFLKYSTYGVGLGIVWLYWIMPKNVVTWIIAAVKDAEVV